MTLSIKPGLPELLELVMDKSNEKLFVALPGKVEKYDANKQVADIKPLLKRRETDANGQPIIDELGVIPNVPVIHPRGGGYFVHFPLKKDDNVLLVFCDRSMDEYVESDGRTDILPSETRTNDVSDAVAIPGWYTNKKPIKTVNSNDFIMGADNGAQMVMADDGSVDINNGNLKVLL